MRELLAKIEDDLSVCLDPNTIEELKVKSNSVEDSISDLFVELFNEPEQFGSLINLRVLKPLSNQINKIEQTMPNRSISNFKDRTALQKVLFYLEDLRYTILNDHSKNLKGTSEYSLFLKRESEKMESEKYSLLHVDFDFVECEYINTISTERFAKLVDKGFLKTFNFFENSFKGDIDRESSKQNLIIFINRLYDKVKRLNRSINTLDSKIEKLKEEDLPEDKVISYELEEGHLEEYNPLHSYWHFMIELSDEKENNIYLKVKLEEFEKKAFLYYPFLSESVIFGVRLKKSVFGNFNYDLLQSLYSEMKFYLRSEIKEHHFTEIFTLNNEPSEMKIDLIEGTLGDFKGIINGLQSQFTNEFSDHNVYNQWWIDRFTFNGVHKDLKSIRKIRGNTDRIPKYPQVIKAIREVFPES